MIDGKTHIGILIVLAINRRVGPVGVEDNNILGSDIQFDGHRRVKCDHIGVIAIAVVERVDAAGKEDGVIFRLRLGIRRIVEIGVDSGEIRIDLLVRGFGRNAVTHIPSDRD